MIYTVTFNPAIDYVMHTQALQLGSVNRAVKEEIMFGGNRLHRAGKGNDPNKC